VCLVVVLAFEGVYPDSNGSDKAIQVTPQMTACTTIFGALSRLRLAVEMGFVLDPKSWWCQCRRSCWHRDTCKAARAVSHAIYRRSVQLSSPV
jgi:hypothetical protein